MLNIQTFTDALMPLITDSTVTVNSVRLDQQLGRLFVTATHARPPATYSDELSTIADGDEAALAATFADLINKGAPLV